MYSQEKQEEKSSCSLEEDIIKIARKKKRLCKKAKARDDANLWSKYKSTNNMLKRKCNEARWDYLRNLANNMHDKKV